MGKGKSPLFFKIQKGFKNLDLRYRKRGVIELGLKRIPFNPRSEAQQTIRSRYGKLVEEWRALTPEEKAEYEAKGKALGLSGWNVYVMEKMPIPPYQGEDFTTYTEVDPNNHISVEAKKITHQAFRNESAYVYKDFGENYFGDFTHKLEVQSDYYQAYGSGVAWMLANDIGDALTLKNNNKTAVNITLYRDGSGNRYIMLREIYQGEYNQAYWTGAEANTKYYLTVKKQGTSLTLEIYSDAERTNLLKTLSVTLHGDWKFRYLYGCSTLNDGSSYRLTNIIENLWIQ